MKKTVLFGLLITLSWQAEVDFPEDFFQMSSQYSRRFDAWQKAFVQNTQKNKVNKDLHKLFLRPKKYAKNRGKIGFGAILLGQLRDHLRGLHESSLLRPNEPIIPDKKKFVQMLKQAWPENFCSRFWGWWDKRPEWVVKYLESNLPNNKHKSNFH